MRHKKYFFAAGLIILAALIAFAINFKNGSQKSSAPYTEKSSAKVKKASGIMNALQMISEIRAYPDSDIPPDKFYKAYEYSQSQLANVFDKTEADTWTSIGPNNIGGRSISFAVHPVDTGTVFMGAASGGLWKSTTGGLGAAAWTLVNTGYPSSAVSSIAIDSVNPAVMYIGTGESYGYQYSNNGVNIRMMRGMYGIGILKTTNGGATWTKSLDWSYNNQRGVWVVAINPKNSNIVYAATTEGVYKSYNAGGSWSQVLNYQLAMDLKINPVDTSVLYVSVGNLTNAVPNANVGIYKSTNSGLAWTKLAGGLPAAWSGKAALEIYWSNPVNVYASIANDLSYVGYYRSTDAGATWSVKSTSIPIGNQGWYNNAHMVKRDDPNTIVVGTLNVEKSANGGTSFSTNSSWSAWITGATPPGQPEGPANFVHADVHFYATNPKDFNKLYCITDGGLYRSNSFGSTNSFYSCNGGYVTTQFYNGFANSFQDSIFCIGGLQDNRSTFYQGTTAWYKTFMGDGMWCAVNSQNPSICYTEYTYGDIYKSVNGGVSWSDISPPGSGSETNYCFAAPYICCRSNPNVVYAGGLSVYKSTVGGGSWQGPYGSFGGGKVLCMDVSATSTDTVYLGTIPAGTTAAAIWKTVNGGLNWTNISGAQIPDRYPTDMVVNPNNSKEVYVTFGGFASGHVYKTSNGGTTWINISGNLPDVPHQSIVVDPLYPNNVYAGNDLGVYASTNGGATWGEYKTGMPYALIYDLTITNIGRKLRATTHGNGVWEIKLSAIPTSIGNSGATVPDKFSLSQNYPNPFNPVTRIKFEVSKTANISIQVFDVTGRNISTLFSREMQAGVYSAAFDASGIGSGVYFYSLLVDGRISETKRMTVLK
jgi:hypothetical protein